jgi:hypothetical protein
MVRFAETRVCFYGLLLNNFFIEIGKIRGSPHAKCGHTLDNQR